MVDNMVYCVSFKDITAQMISEVGIKALNIAELHNRGYPVPRGFVIRSRALADYLLKNKIADQVNAIMETAGTHNYTSLTEASRKISDLIMAGTMPETLMNEITNSYKDLTIGDDMRGLNELAKNMINAGRGDAHVSVRISPVIEGARATATAQGLYPASLNISGIPPLYKAIIKCFSLFYSPHAIYYYRRNNLRSAELAIIVQTMVSSEKSGVLTTANPVTGNTGEFLIESSYGIGDRIATGDIIPDRYTINIKAGTIADVRVYKKQRMTVMDPLNGGVAEESVPQDLVAAPSISAGEIKAIVEISDKIQAQFSRPQCIEWAIAKQRAYILQSVPLAIMPQRDVQSQPQASATAPVAAIAPQENGAGSTPLCTGTYTGAASQTPLVEGEAKVINSAFDLGTISASHILVAPQASIELLPVLKSVKGAITSNGGLFCNMAKMSRELGVPLIVGAGEGTTKIASGAEITMDTKTGNIYDRKEKVERFGPIASDALASQLPPFGPQGEDEPIIATKIKLNVFSEADCENMKGISDGVGFMYFDGMAENPQSQSFQPGAPNIDPAMQSASPQGSAVLKVIDAFYPKSVWLKTRSVTDPLFKNQLAELKMIYDKGYSNVGVMFPGVHHQSYLAKIRDIAREVGLNLSSIEYGIVVDTPASCVLSEDFSNMGLKFVSIDYEKLIKNILGLDASTKITNHDTHPAVLKIIRNCIKSYRKYNIHTSIHGNSITNQFFIEKLIEYHIDSISVNKSDFKISKYVAARTEKKMILDIMSHKNYMR